MHCNWGDMFWSRGHSPKMKTRRYHSVDRQVDNRGMYGPKMNARHYHGVDKQLKQISHNFLPGTSLVRLTVSSFCKKFPLF